MLEQLPETVKPFSLADSRQALDGELPLARMPRLTEQLDDSSGTVAVTLQFGCDSQRIPFVQGRIRADLTMTCQRCMESVRVPVNIDFSLALLRSAAGMNELPVQYEPLVVDSARMSLLAMVEDELLLALPIVAMHDTAECHAGERDSRDSTDDGQDQESNPFAVLAGLKKGQAEKSG